MVREHQWFLVGAVMAVLLCASPGARAQALPALGTDITNLNLCLYGDCEARGAYAADPWGWANPATMPSLVLDYAPRGGVASMAYFRLNSGGVAADIESPTAALTLSPFVFLVSPVFGEASGRGRMLPGLDLRLRFRTVRLAAAVDLERALGIPGLSVGILGEVPGLATDLRIAAGKTVVATATEHHELNLTFGAHWRGGHDHWFMAGAFINPVRNHMVSEILGTRAHGTTDAWFGRVGFSVLPFVPLGIAEGTAPLAEWLHEIRIGADGEHRNLAVPGEPSRRDWTGYFGADVPLFPERWTAVSNWIRVTAIAGIDTDRGWGIGAGITGTGMLGALSCNPAYSSRALTPVLGRRTDVWGISCAIAAPF